MKYFRNLGGIRYWEKLVKQFLTFFLILDDENFTD